MTASLRESLAPTVARGAEAPLKPDCSAVFGDALVTLGLPMSHWAQRRCDHRRLLPASFALGASYLLLIDDLSRTISTQEVPIGILTALIGAPFFAVLLRRTGAGWQ